MTTATAQASPNIAFIRCWGDSDNALRIPMNGSISMNLDGLFTRTTVSFQPSLPFDELIINGHEVAGTGRERVSYILDTIRGMARIDDHAEVMTTELTALGHRDGPVGFGVCCAGFGREQSRGLDLNEQDLSRLLARLGSGSAARSIPGGFVEWQAGTCDENSFAYSIAEVDHWRLMDCVAIVSASHKKTGSTEGHSLRANQSAPGATPGGCNASSRTLPECDPGLRFQCLCFDRRARFGHDALGHDDLHPCARLLEACPRWR